MIWCAIKWAHKQGAEVFDMEGTRAYSSCGSFVSKQAWGARVAERDRICQVWQCAARDPSPALLDHVNELGLISEVDGRFCAVLLNDGQTDLAEAEVRDSLLDVKDRGLDGLVVVSPGREPVVHLADA
jgi:hypothetical protein